MPLTNLRNRYCCICHRRGDFLRKKKIQITEVKENNQLTSPSSNLIIGSLICQKHLKKSIYYYTFIFNHYLIKF